MKCKLCNANSLYYLDRKYKMIRCKNCGLQSLFHIPPQEELFKIYQKDYFKAWGNEYNDKIITTLKEKLYRSILKRIERFKSPGKLLDAGCAFGHSFQVAIRRRWEPYGVEISKDAYKIASQKFPSRIIFGDFSNVELINNHYDLVLMFDFLEHTQDIIKTMLKTHKILKPKGLVAIVIPNISSFSARLMRGYWIHIKLEHIYYLSNRSLKTLFIRTGFRPILFKTIWKPINLLYFENQIKKYGLRYQSLIIKLLKGLIPNYMHRLNIYLPQGEIFALAEKR